MSNTAEKLGLIVNGIDTQHIVELATHMGQDPNFGRFQFRAHNQWEGGAQSRSTVQNFYAGGEERNERTTALEVISDQPNFLGGTNAGPNAVEHYLNALSSCLSTTIIAHASVQGLAIESLLVDAEGHMDARGFFGVSEDAARGYTRIEVRIEVKGDVTEDTIRTMSSFSPVYEMVKNAVSVSLAIAVK